MWQARASHPGFGFELVGCQLGSGDWVLPQAARQQLPRSKSMATTGKKQYNVKNPGVKRILQEAKELSNDASSELFAAPLEVRLVTHHWNVALMSA